MNIVYEESGEEGNKQFKYRKFKFTAPGDSGHVKIENNEKIANYRPNQNEPQVQTAMDAEFREYMENNRPGQNRGHGIGGQIAGGVAGFFLNQVIFETRTLQYSSKKAIVI